MPGLRLIAKPCFHSSRSEEKAENYESCDRSRADCLRCLQTNPDLPKRLCVSCFCGERINTRTDWYVMLADGTAACYQCARCARCHVDGALTNKKLVSIDGFVMCYQCLEDYGYPIKPPNRFKVDKFALDLECVQDDQNLKLLTRYNERFEKKNKLMQQAEIKDGREQKQKLDFNFRKHRQWVDHQKQTGKIERYTDQTKFDASDPRQTPPPYDARVSAGEGSEEVMLCPNCGKHAVGRHSYIVPSMAKVYHRACFNCVSCSRNLSYGTKLPNKHFQYCNCELPKLWCVSATCKRKRVEHHEFYGCTLGCVRPGGRLQMDTNASDKFAD